MKVSERVRGAKVASPSYSDGEVFIEIADDASEGSARISVHGVNMSVFLTATLEEMAAMRDVLDEFMGRK